MTSLNATETAYREAGRAIDCEKEGGCPSGAKGWVLHHKLRPGERHRKDPINLQVLCEACHVAGHQHSTIDSFPPGHPQNTPYSI